MEIIGRVTANSTRKFISEGREVVNFSIVINDSYRPKGSKEIKKIITFIDCAYWLNAGIAQYITKGTIVELSGRIAAKGFKTMDDEVRASLYFHVNSIKLHGGGGKKEEEVISEPLSENEPVDDLPF